MHRPSIPVGVITLGCAKNEVDSEYMLSELESAGFTITEELSEAVAIVVNSCAFIQPAKEESIETILEAARYKETGRCKVLAVVGCMAQRYARQLRSEMPEVDIFLGVGEAQKNLARLLQESLGVELSGGRRHSFPRLVETAARGWAYLKISEGCNNRCTYCAIPLIRGNLVSRPEADILEEARYLESLGVLELNLIAQDVTAYGSDRESGTGHLVKLLEQLLERTNIPWIRLLYTHPAHLDESLLEFIAANRRILPYLDLPVQHASNRILERMGRKVTKEEILRKINLARQIIGDPVLRTTVLVGFPGERKRDFEELVEFIQQVRFDRLGGFVYSREEDTPAAEMRQTVSQAEKEERLEIVLALQRTISAERNAERVGQTLPVLVERAVDPLEAPAPVYRWLGRSAAHAPEVDGVVYLAGEGCAPGKIVRARITASADYDLFATAIG